LGARTHWGSSRFIWLASDLPLSSFSFFFREDQAGLWQVHPYPYTEGRSTFIVETDEATWRAAGLGDADEAASLDYLSALFAPELSGYRLYTNRSFWRQFPTIECARWSSGKVTLLGDAAHTAHFSIGSGTRLAMQGANALAKALLQSGDVEAAQRRYEADHRPEVERLQGAAENSRLWFEEAAFYHGQLSARELTTSMMNRTHGGRGSRARPPLYSAG
jgi:anthraniloyl-CoA monooxygenase